MKILHNPSGQSLHIGLSGFEDIMNVEISASDADGVKQSLLAEIFRKTPSGPGHVNQTLRFWLQAGCQHEMKAFRVLGYGHGDVVVDELQEDKLLPVEVARI
mmetsp:Transcript_12362/g.30786  ORF Transcript_12362/g.30786 Transcript_12362/m.30786 type:complete len:102 (-) Transcript_12362:766-1071(-)|eukprot:CAMPEP_0113248628 /NCGR_PEP_ID=MMETSP0008_2-20120614/10619_1 /TAXON_ID=97485 /ORGANISM="Prymnesium parvum" /LENGTH=101 /DNA_ID=CAMNT_0000096491 /DNA_START=287 /DNA_END=592 /DNA_ORIENTATION=+ /assembly_acc=CAM_ASM_000153